MKIVSKIKWMILVASVSALFVMSTGCSSHPNEEQIRVMEEARSAALAAEQKLADKRQECNARKPVIRFEVQGPPASSRISAFHTT